MKYLFFLSILFLISTQVSYGQTEKRSGKKQKEAQISPSSTDQGGSFNETKIFSGTGTTSRKNKKSGAFPTKADKIKEYEARMEANAKKYEEQEKEMAKPRYADPTYFGHKRKPKKREPGKKKFCKECGISH